MKRNIFWTVWGVASLVCVLIAGFKSFAIELEKKTADNRPQYLASELSPDEPITKGR